MPAIQTYCLYLYTIKFYLFLELVIILYYYTPTLVSTSSKSTVI